MQRAAHLRFKSAAVSSLCCSGSHELSGFGPDDFFFFFLVQWELVALELRVA